MAPPAHAYLQVTGPVPNDVPMRTHGTGRGAQKGVTKIMGGVVGIETDGHFARQKEPGLLASPAVIISAAIPMPVSRLVKPHLDRPAPESSIP